MTDKLVDFSDEENSYSSSEEDEPLDPCEFLKYLTVSYEDDSQIQGHIKLTHFLKHIAIWPYNRKLDKKHVRELKESIKKTRRVFGSFIIGSCEDNYWLIDGQHRHEALSQLNMIDDFKLHHPIFLSIYKAPSDDEIVELFEKINNAKPLTPKDTPNLVVVRAISKLKKDFPLAIKDQKLTVYPYMTISELKEKLLTVADGKTAEQLYSAVRKQNNFYAEIIPPTRIPNIRRKIGKSCAIPKAQKAHFYLGLDTTRSWVENL